jgi:hypothetical protein
MSNQQAIRNALDDMAHSVKHAVPWDTTFLFLESGCGSVGQETPLAHAIEESLRRRFELWAATWITPRIDDALAQLNSLASADKENFDLRCALRQIEGAKQQDDAFDARAAVKRLQGIARAAIAKAQGGAK